MVAMSTLPTFCVDVVNQHSIFTIDIVPEKANLSHFALLVDVWQESAWLRHNFGILHLC